MYVQVPVGSTLAFTAPTCLCYILGNYGYARSQGERQPAAAKTPFLVLSYLLHRIYYIRTAQ